MAVAAGEGAILAHAVRTAGLSLRKGEVVSEDHVLALEAAGVTAIIGARLEAGDVPENVAAARLAERVVGHCARMERPFTGRCNLMAETAGLVRIDAATIDAINARDEAITVATLAPWQPVVAGEMIATIKIIPFAVAASALDRALDSARTPSVEVLPYLPLRVGVISTVLPSLKPATVAKTLQVLQNRLTPARASIVEERRVAHDVGPLTEAIGTIAPRVDLVIVFGASAITDRRDVVPLAIEQAGGRVEHLGMPVDPGNLLLLGRFQHQDGAGAVPILGAPGCARSAKENGFDFVLRRMLVGVTVRGVDLRAMGVGGLLSEIVSRPQPRRDADG